MSGVRQKRLAMFGDLGRGTYVPHALARAVGAKAAYMLCQLMHLQAVKGEGVWFYKTDADLAKEIALTASERRAARTRLRAAGLLDHEVMPTEERGHVLTHYRVNVAAVRRVCENRKPGLRKPQAGVAETANDQLRKPQAGVAETANGKIADITNIISEKPENAKTQGTHKGTDTRERKGDHESTRVPRARTPSPDKARLQYLVAQGYPTTILDDLPASISITEIDELVAYAQTALGGEWRAGTKFDRDVKRLILTRLAEDGATLDELRRHVDYRKTKFEETGYEAQRNLKAIWGEFFDADRWHIDAAVVYEGEEPEPVDEEVDEEVDEPVDEEHPAPVPAEDAPDDAEERRLRYQREREAHEARMETIEWEREAQERREAARKAEERMLAAHPGHRDFVEGCSSCVEDRARWERPGGRRGHGRSQRTAAVREDDREHAVRDRLRMLGVTATTDVEAALALWRAEVGRMLDRDEFAVIGEAEAMRALDAVLQALEGAA